ncbi:MAG TPA: hypothetical protein VFR04_09015 [Solirubrobacterales bacterium]|nr:hypothetical protein [Solirubrobacterales bacterium]
MSCESALSKMKTRTRPHHDRVVFLLRLALLVLMLAAAYRLLIRLRSRNPRYLPAALALIGATAVLAIAMATDYIEFAEVGPLAISIVGIALTLVAFVTLQRFLAKRGQAGPARGVSLLRVPASRQAPLRGVRASRGSPAA